MRVRPGYHPGGIQAYRFNPRTRESATRGWRGRRPRVFGFNPRTRESATKNTVKEERRSGVSIHALVRVRHEGALPGYQCRGFNPRTRESATSPV